MSPCMTMDTNIHTSTHTPCSLSQLHPPTPPTPPNTPPPPSIHPAQSTQMFPSSCVQPSKQSVTPSTHVPPSWCVVQTQGPCLCGRSLMRESPESWGTLTPVMGPPLWVLASSRYVLICGCFDAWCAGVDVGVEVWCMGENTQWAGVSSVCIGSGRVPVVMNGPWAFSLPSHFSPTSHLALLPTCFQQLPQTSCLLVCFLKNIRGNLTCKAWRINSTPSGGTLLAPLDTTPTDVWAAVDGATPHLQADNMTDATFWTSLRSTQHAASFAQFQGNARNGYDVARIVIHPQGYLMAQMLPLKVGVFFWLGGCLGEMDGGRWRSWLLCFHT